LTRKLQYFLTSLFIVGWLFFIGPSYAWATDQGGQEQVVVSPAQQAVNDALATATTEVAQAVLASETATSTITTAVQAVTASNTAVSAATTAVTAAITAVSEVPLLTETATTLIQSAQTLIESTTATVSASNTAVVAVAPTIAEAQIQLTQANVAINTAQDAVNALVSTIGTTSNVLLNTDDAGIRMNLPFNLQLGGVTYSNVYVSSNATITFGVNEGQNYYSTPNAPSISVAGYDWTTWSDGSGITYSTTTNTLSIAWDVRVFPLTTAETQMTQIRFDADVNPADGAWSADINVTGPIPNGTRFNVRETAGGAITNTPDTNLYAGYNATISQGAVFTPTPDPDNATVLAAIDTANSQIATLNSTITSVVATNTANTNTVIAPIATVSQNTLNALSTAATTLATKLAEIAAVIPVYVEPAPELAPVAPTPEELPAEEPPAEEPPAEEPPAEEPPAEEPPAEEPPAEEPPAEEPPAEEPPAEEPPAEEPPAEEPPTEEPPTEEPPLTVEEIENIIDELVASGELSKSDSEIILNALREDGEITSDEVSALSEALSADGEFTREEVALVVEAIIEAADGEAITAEAIADAGLTYNDLPDATPIEVRQDENGNSVIIVAEIAAALQVLESPAKFVSAIFDDPGQALTAVLNIGADMSNEERKEAEEMVVSAIIATNAAINAVSVAGSAAANAASSASRVTTGGSTPKGPSGGGPVGGDPRIRRRKP
jgi:polyhydroxyalkanoate synthesis regulator phasin